MTKATQRTSPCNKNEIMFFLQMSQLYKSAQYVCRYKNLLRLNVHGKRSIPEENTKN